MRRLVAALLVPLFVVAGCCVLLGVYHSAMECRSSWYKDGGVFYEDDGTEVIFSSNPIRIGNVLLSWNGPVWIAIGVAFIAGLWRAERRWKVTKA